MKRLLTLILVAVGSIQMNAQTLYGDMEQWNNFTVGISPSATLEAPKGWRCPDSLAYSFNLFLGTTHRQLFKTTDAHGGSFAAKIMTAEQGTMIGMLPGVMTNAEIVIDVSAQTFDLRGGTPVTGRVNYVNAWIKYLPKGGDTANVVAAAIITGGASDGTDSVLGTAMQIFAATPSYTLVSLPLVYDDPNAVPDAVKVIFTSSGTQATDSSTLYVDDVSYTLYPISVGNVTANSGVRVYPNPANNALYINGPATVAVTWQVTNMNGQVVATENFTGNKQVDVSGYAPGLYFYTITDNTGAVITRDKFVKK